MHGGQEGAQEVVVVGCMDKVLKAWELEGDRVLRDPECVDQPKNSEFFARRKSSGQSWGAGQAAERRLFMEASDLSEERGASSSPAQL